VVRNETGELVMLDIAMLALTVLFFAVSAAYVVACDRLE
jgi:hypothetical protein